MVILARMRHPARQKKTSGVSTTARGPSSVFSDRVVIAIVCIFLAAIVWITFGQTLRHDFINYDDNEYVYENPKITAGLTLSGIGWAFTHVHADNWHPLTTISHMLDCQLYGLHPWGHHLTNILLHATAAILLFLALRKLTGTIWPSAFVAAIFAIHPLRVESVAWVSERKDVLSGVFFMLTLWAYAAYARSDRPSPVRYLTVVVLFALGLMCKPTLVTLPFVLLLLDYWPLGRLTTLSLNSKVPRAARKHQLFTHSFQYLLLEKIPLLVLSAASCLATILAQKKVLEENLNLTFPERAGNAVVSYVAYLGEMIYPTRLVVFHPYPEGNLQVPQAILSLLVLLLLSVIFFLWRRKYPFLLVGWLWYLGTLVPMIGLVQVGVQARADRYTYLSQIGLSIVVTWGVMELLARWRRGREVVVVAALFIVATLVAVSFNQTSHWRNSTTFWRYAIDIAPDNYIAHNNLGNVLLKEGKLDEAITHFQEALRIKANDIKAHYNLGNCYLLKNEMYRAIQQYQEALKLSPNLIGARNNLAVALWQSEQAEQAIAQWEETLRIEPDNIDARNNLAWILATSSNPSIRDGAKALKAAERLRRPDLKDDPRILRTLAALDAENGRFQEAIDTVQRAIQLANAQGNSTLAKMIETDLELYRANTRINEAGRASKP